jgi:serine protease Do
MPKSGGNEGIGFAIPASTVRNVYEQLRGNGVVSRGSIGVFAQNITPAMAKGLDLPVQHGAMVSDVEPDGPADAAGIKRRDVIVSLNATAIESARQLSSAVYQAKAGHKVTLGVRRGQMKLGVEVVVAARSTPPPSLAALVSPQKSLIRRLGIYCIELSGQAADLIPSLRRHYGLVVAGRSPEGQAQFIDLRPGDVIHAVNNLPTSSLDLFRTRIEDLEHGDSVALQIERGGRFQYLAFEIE